VTVWQYGRLS